MVRAGARTPRSAVRRAGSQRAVFLCLVFLLAASVAGFAELSSSVTIAAFTGVLRFDDRANVSAAVEGSLDLKSVGNKNVKGQLQLESALTETFLYLDVPRAYVKVRFPWFRFTLGKTRVSWGDGFVFNAGDVIWGSMEPITEDFSAAALRDQTAWLAALYLPLGPFSYLEGVIFPYNLEAGSRLIGTGGAGETDIMSFLVPEPTDEILSLARFSELAGGLRGAFKLGKTTLEGGYFVIGRGIDEHRPYLSLHGHLLVDWNLSTSFTVPLDRPDWGQWDEWFSISAGVFHLVNLGADRTLSFRLETAIRPGLRWSEASGATEYGIYIFPELAFAPSNTVSLQLRSLISPVDLSALTMASVSWNVYQGLNVLSHLSIKGGDRNDLYGVEQDYGVSWIAGLEFIY